MANTGYDFPVDAVYLWVDGQDPAWRARRAAALQRQAGGMEAVAKEAVTPALSRENDELCYSLRSLERFAPWVRRVHVIVDQQLPAWLNTENVHVVELENMLPPEAAYPLFNSHAIELCMDFISDLAEQYLTFNDDFMLGASVHKADFFLPDGSPKVWLALKREKSGCTCPATQSMRRAFEAHTRDVIERAFHICYAHKVRHYPRTQTKSSIRDFRRQFPEETGNTLRAVFRSAEDFSTPLGYALFLAATGKGKVEPINGIAELWHFLQRRIRHIGASLGDANAKSKMRCIRFFAPLTFCINDSPGASKEDRDALRAFLQNMFPAPSRFER